MQVQGVQMDSTVSTFVILNDHFFFSQNKILAKQNLVSNKKCCLSAYVSFTY